MAKIKNRTVVRTILHFDTSGQTWFGGEHDRHNVGELLQVIEHAHPGAIKLHRPDGDRQEKVVFDLYAPENMSADGEKVWARMEAERMASFGYNSVPAPEWKEG